MAEVFLGLGSNIDRDAHLQAALKAIQQQFGKLQASSVYESEAVGFSGPRFYNMVVRCETDLGLEDLSRQLRQIEIDNGRGKHSEKFAPRTLDIDILLYGDTVTGKDSSISLPRADITHYAFVLEPLAELAPNHRHPVLDASFAELWQQFDKRDLQQKRISCDWAR